MAKQDQAKQHNKPNLSEVFEKKREQEAETVSVAAVEKKASGQDLPPSRQGKRRVSGWFPPQVKKQIQHIAVDKEMTQEEVMALAFNLLFREENLPTIA